MVQYPQADVILVKVKLICRSGALRLWHIQRAAKAEGVTLA